MTNPRLALALGGTFLAAFSALAQPPPASPAPVAGTPPAAPAGAPAAAPARGGRGAPLQNPNPHYASVQMSVDVNAPVDRVWARVGKFADIGEWLGRGGGTTILSGTDGEFGAVRSIGNEVLVGRTKYSYTYAAPPREGPQNYDLYHGTLEAVPLTAGTTRLNYTLVFDNSNLADDAAREADSNNRRTTFTRALGNMKILAEGGTLPAPAARAGGAAPGGGAAPVAGGPAGGASRGGGGRGALLNPSPRYVSIPMTMEVNAPVDRVWARIGKFCDIGEWGFGPCTMLSGTEGELGGVRSIGNEVLVGKTQYSYVYTQPMRATGGYNMYHGTLEAVALTPTTTQLNYTLFLDNSSLADDAAREADVASRRNTFTGLLRNMKILAEGGTLPPGAVRGGRAGSAAPAPTAAPAARGGQ